MHLKRLFKYFEQIVHFFSANLMIYLCACCRWTPTNSLCDNPPRTLSSFLNHKVYFVNICRTIWTPYIILFSHKNKKKISFRARISSKQNLFWTNSLRKKDPIFENQTTSTFDWLSKQSCTKAMPQSILQISLQRRDEAIQDQIHKRIHPLMLKMHRAIQAKEILSLLRSGIFRLQRSRRQSLDRLRRMRSLGNIKITLIIYSHFFLPFSFFAFDFSSFFLFRNCADLNSNRLFFLSPL